MWLQEDRTGSRRRPGRMKPQYVAFCCIATFSPLWANAQSVQELIAHLDRWERQQYGLVVHYQFGESPGTSNFSSDGTVFQVIDIEGDPSDEAEIATIMLQHYSSSSGWFRGQISHYPNAEQTHQFGLGDSSSFAQFRRGEATSMATGIIGQDLLPLTRILREGSTRVVSRSPDGQLAKLRCHHPTRGDYEVELDGRNDFFPTSIRLRKHSNEIWLDEQRVPKHGGEAVWEQFAYRTFEDRNIVHSYKYAAGALGKLEPSRIGYQVTKVERADPPPDKALFSGFSIRNNLDVRMENDETVKYVYRDGEVCKVVDSRVLAELDAMNVSAPPTDAKPATFEMRFTWILLLVFAGAAIVFAILVQRRRNA